MLTDRAKNHIKTGLVSDSLKDEFVVAVEAIPVGGQVLSDDLKQHLEIAMCDIKASDAFIAQLEAGSALAVTDKIINALEVAFADKETVVEIRAEVEA